MQQGTLFAHATSTISGVACISSNLTRLRLFKQRHGPFLLLAANTRAALRLTPYISSVLRAQLKQGWPEKTTLIFRVRQTVNHHLSKHCRVAVRVDDNEDCRFLAKQLGGVFMSSSLNRRAKETSSPSPALHWRWQRFGIRCDSYDSHETTGKASTLLRIKSKCVECLR